jgi:8-oxo-dGTP pyrophosphatase MutT (NUDIX family)
LLADRIEALRNRRANILGHEQSLKTAVLLPLVERDGKICILFEKRSHTLQHQPGEICFPGGMKDPDDPQALDTAIRETCEELGITPDNIEVIGELDTLITPSSLIMRSFVARIKNSNLIEINRAEVEKVFMIPLDFLLQYGPKEHVLSLKPDFPDDFPLQLIPHGANYPFRLNRLQQYFYLWEGEVIWGLTARILHHFIELLKENEQSNTGE